MRVRRTRTFAARRVSAAFAFPLEPLLRLRQAREAHRVFELAQARRRLERAQARARELERELAKAVSQIGYGGAARAAEYDAAADEARSAVARCEDDVRAAADELTVARRDRKAIELLKIRRLAEHAAAQARKEERELDEANHR
jgi:flagellar export protein FliJ